MKKVEVTVNGLAYPCRVTMGAMLLFKRETGREASEIENGSLSDLITFVWCCVRSASRADGIDFVLTLDEFADSIDADTAGTVFQAISDDPGGASGGGGKKKK